VRQDYGKIIIKRQNLKTELENPAQETLAQKREDPGKNRFSTSSLWLIFAAIFSAVAATFCCLPALLFLIFGVILNYLIPDSKLFLYLYSASVFPGMIAWFVLAYSQKRFRAYWGKEAMDAHKFKSPLYPYANWFCIAFLVLVTIGMWFNEDTRMSLISSWVYMVVITVFYFICGLNKKEYDIHGNLQEKGANNGSEG